MDDDDALVISVAVPEQAPLVRGDVASCQCPEIVAGLQRPVGAFVCCICSILTDRTNKMAVNHTRAPGPKAIMSSFVYDM